MATPDLDMLLDMGFEREKAELAVKKTGNREAFPIVLARTSSNEHLSARRHRLARKKPGQDGRRDQGS